MVEKIGKNLVKIAAEIRIWGCEIWGQKPH